MGNYVVVTTKSWNIKNYEILRNMFKNDAFYLITKKEDLKEDYLASISPDYIFFPHWSWMIPENIFDRFNCVVFHMTDLPFGRGGSPLQNLLVRGIYSTKISAVRVSKGSVDSGDIYFKNLLDIGEGSADEILIRTSDIIFKVMIPRFINDDNLYAVPQSGEVVTFERRKPEQSEIPQNLSERQLYDYIRMLDGEGYPTAFIQTNYGKIYFKDAKIVDGQVFAKAQFAIVSDDEER